MLISLDPVDTVSQNFGDFYRATAMLSAVYAVVVCVSVTLRYCIKTLSLIHISEPTRPY